MGIRISVSGSPGWLGFLELSLGDPAAALPHFGARTSFGQPSCSNRLSGSSSATCSRR